MTTDKPVPLVGVDWGTTHRRAYAMDSLGHCVADMADEAGALRSKGHFSEALQVALEALHVQPACVLMAGMVGSTLGWHEVPYLDGNTPLQDLGRHLHSVPDAGNGLNAAIIPGYCIRNAQGQPDVMRGEETQLLGAWAQGHVSGWFVLPGTHSKWVLLDRGRILQLRTYMTGELFDLLGQHGTLAAAVGQESAAWDEAAFEEGVRQSGRLALSHQLFACRARVVSKDMPAASSRAYLSGLLIGTELKDVLQGSGTAAASEFKLIGSPQLATLYQHAARVLDARFDLLDARQVFLAALSHLQAR